MENKKKMKREIKFRAWDGQRMICKKGSFESADILKYYSNPMQYTGINDVNGKEIYEGDILVRILPNGEHGRKIVCEDIREVFMTNNIANDKHLIIGSIYENPELI